MILMYILNEETGLEAGVIQKYLVEYYNYEFTLGDVRGVSFSTYYINLSLFLQHSYTFIFEYVKPTGYRENNIRKTA